MVDCSTAGSRGRLNRAAACLAAALACAASPAFPAAGSAQEPAPAGRFFQTADRCMACHNGLVTRSGEDVSIGFDWRASMMANSARDPYWQAAVRREIIDHPRASAAIQDECSKCHMPMMRFEAHANGGAGSVVAHLPPGAAGPTQPLAADGVSCTVCHQIQADGLGTRESFVGGFTIDTMTTWPRALFGPFHVDSGRTTLMRSAARFQPTQATHVQQSELCATCHTLYTHALGPNGDVIGELPEQVPFLEWQHSAYVNEQSCQSCHMPVVRDSVAVTGVLGQPRADVSRHVFRGGNFFMLRMLNRYRADLGVVALPQELEAAASRTVQHLQTAAARVAIDDVATENGRLRARVTVQNLAGHKLPTAYPSRRAWLHVTVRDAAGAVVFESGSLTPEGRIVGNDNDDDAARFEPHHTRIERPDQVQIYESIMAGPSGAVTTGLLTAVRFVKDNRVLPRGFEKTTAHEDIAVHGDALSDADFRDGSDTIEYVVNVRDARGPFRVEAELWYQPIAFRWAHNLAPYDAHETRRFVSYYTSMSETSAVVLARAAR